MDRVAGKASPTPIMSGEQKVKVEPGGGNKNNSHQNVSKFKAPTPGLEDKVFDYERESTHT